MTERLAIIACAGDLPVLLHQRHPGALVITLEGIESDLAGVSQAHRLEQIGALFDAMKADGVTDVIFAGALTRPILDRAKFDDKMAMVAPRLVAAFQMGDDALLRTVIDVFEEQGFNVRGVHDVLPDLVAGADLTVGPDPSEKDEADIARAADILTHIAALDVGQGCAVAGGQCLGIETVQGTDALLRFVGETPDRYRNAGQKGVYVKAAKKGQDLRMDMPAIGPKTVEAVAAAGLAGIVVENDRVLILNREATLQAAETAQIFLRARTL